MGCCVVRYVFNIVAQCAFRKTTQRLLEVGKIKIFRIEVVVKSEHKCVKSIFNYLKTGDICVSRAKVYKTGGSDPC